MFFVQFNGTLSNFAIRASFAGLKLLEELAEGRKPIVSDLKFPFDLVQADFPSYTSIRLASDLLDRPPSAPSSIAFYDDKVSYPILSLLLTYPDWG